MSRKRLFSYENNRFSWSEWRDSNSRHPGPKPGALPTGPHPDIYFFFLRKVVKHVVKFHFLPPKADYQWKFSLAPQRLFCFHGRLSTSRAPAPKPDALPTGPHPDIYFCATHPMDILYHPRQIVNGNFCPECGNYTPHPHRMQSATFFSCEKRSILSECLSSIAVPAARWS